MCQEITNTKQKKYTILFKKFLQFQIPNNTIIIFESDGNKTISKAYSKLRK